MPIKGVGVRVQDALALLLEVVELPAVQGPGEDAEDAEHEHGRQGDEEVQDVHGVQRARRSAFSTTTSELVAMPSPAAHGGSQPASASGTQAAL